MSIQKRFPDSSASLFVGLCLLALLARLAVIFALKNFSGVTGFENEEIALNLIAGRGYSWSRWGILEPTAFMYPLYTFFLAAHFWLFGHRWLPVEISQAVIGALGTPLIVVLGSRLFDRGTGWLAGLIYALYPVYVYWCAQGQGLVIETVLLMAWLIAAIKMAEAKGPAWAWAAGALLGLLALSKTLYLLLVPALALWLWARNTRPPHPHNLSTFQPFNLSTLPPFHLWLRLCIMLVVAGAVIFPWTSRNVAVFHRLILVTDNTGYNLWLGNNPAATGGLFAADGRAVTESMDPALRATVLAAPDDPARDAVFREAAWSYLRADPGAFFRRIPGKLRALWYFEPTMPSRFHLLRVLAYLALLALALPGMVLARRRWKDHLIFYLLFLTITAIYLVFFGQARFRFVLEFGLILFAGYAVCQWGQLTARRP